MDLRYANGVKGHFFGALAVLALLVGLVVLKQATETTPRTPARALTPVRPSALAPSPRNAARTESPLSGALGAGPRVPFPPAAAPHDRARENAVHERLGEHLFERPALYTVSSVTCDERSCRVELETEDLPAFSPVLARFQEPETGFVGEAEMIELERPVALGENGTGPWRVVFTLWGREPK